MPSLTVRGTPARVAEYLVHHATGHRSPVVGDEIPFGVGGAVFGRDPAAIVSRHPGRLVVFLAYPPVSRAHAVIRSEGEGFVLEDLHTRTGLTLNGVHVRVAPLRDGDVIRITDFVFVFREDGDAPNTRPASGDIA